MLGGCKTLAATAAYRDSTSTHTDRTDTSSASPTTQGNIYLAELQHERGLIFWNAARERWNLPREINLLCAVWFYGVLSCQKKMWWHLNWMKFDTANDIERSPIFIPAWNQWKMKIHNFFHQRGWWLFMAQINSKLQKEINSSLKKKLPSFWSSACCRFFLWNLRKTSEQKFAMWVGAENEIALRTSSNHLSIKHKLNYHKTSCSAHYQRRAH